MQLAGAVIFVAAAHYHAQRCHAASAAAAAPADVGRCAMLIACLRGRKCKTLSLRNHMKVVAVVLPDSSMAAHCTPPRLLVTQRSEQLLHLLPTSIGDRTQQAHA